ncbi:hypothetical protein CC2G_012037 [Coprinopsis cinerea AmutBmut pab1-1]|nr:hypothetical protein CC2G_012037 [Coprinopsis cinerea AmutBmut pab1-1]
MGKMDENAPLASVKKARDKLEKAAKSCRGDDDLTSQLLRSIEDFTTRIIPLFEEFHNQRQELEQARKQNEKLQNEKAELGKRLAKSQWYHSENERLRNEVIQAQRIADEATVAGEKLKDLLTETRNDLASYKKIAADLDKDKKRMADQLERNSNAAKNSREKVKDVRAQNAELQKKIESLEQRLLETPHSPVSQPQPHDYDGDFSSHELKTPSRYLVKSSQPPPPPPLPEDIDFFEGMPRPGFGSDWQLNRGKENCSVLKKTRPVGGPTHRRVTNPVGLMALSLDRKGKPTTAVQLGPKRTVRI